MQKKKKKVYIEKYYIDIRRKFIGRHIARRRATIYRRIDILCIPFMKLYIGSTNDNSAVPVPPRVETLAALSWRCSLYFRDRPNLTTAVESCRKTKTPPAGVEQDKEPSAPCILFLQHKEVRPTFVTQSSPTEMRLQY